MWHFLTILSQNTCGISVYAVLSSLNKIMFCSICNESTFIRDSGWILFTRLLGLGSDVMRTPPWPCSIIIISTIQTVTHVDALRIPQYFILQLFWQQFCPWLWLLSHLLWYPSYIGKKLYIKDPSCSDQMSIQTWLLTPIVPFAGSSPHQNLWGPFAAKPHGTRWIM